MTARRLAVLVSVLTVAVTAAGSAPSSAAELGFFGWGVRGGVSIDPDQVFGGVHFELGEFSEGVLFRPNVELGVGDDETVLSVNGAVLWLLPRSSGQWRPYIGGELGINHREIDRPEPFGDRDETDLAINFAGGVETTRKGGGRLMLEGKIGLAEKPRVKLLLGWTF